MDPQQEDVRIGQYRLLSRLGAGGMGEVYLAEDTRLHRRVALKLLLGTEDESSRKRLLREARAAATLDHPNICTVFEVGDADGRSYIAMQYVEGETLASRLQREPLALPDALGIAAQIAAALDEAHRRGVIHRDIKPQNIILSAQNRVKVLDFGLALLTAHDTGEFDATTLMASAGISGTVPYMSPEQLRGEPLDSRSDIFSFGVVLYELLARIHPFFAGGHGGTIAAILTQDPPPLATSVPSEPQRIVRKCLEKDRERRYQSMRDCLIDLESFTRESVSPSKTHSSGTDVDVSTPPRRIAVRRLATGVAVAVAVLGVAAVWLFSRYRERPLRVSAADFVQLTNFPDTVASPTVSPDGRLVAFIRGGGWFLSQGQIYVKALPDGEARQLTHDTRLKYGPVFTPDGTRITYTAVDSKNWDTWSVPVLGGEPTRLLPNASGLTWLDQRRVLFSEIEGTGLHMGVVTATVDRADYRRIYFPAHERAMAHFSYASPDRKSILVAEMDRTGNWLPCRVVPFDGSSSGRQAGPEGPCTAAGWSLDGRFMYFSATVAGTGHLWRQRFPDGTPEPVTTGSATKEEGLGFAPDGRSIVTSVGQIQGSLWVHDTRGDRLVPLEGLVSTARLSDDGKRVYCLVDAAGEPHPRGVTVVDLTSGAMDRILEDFPIVDFDVSSDSQVIAFTTITTSGERQIWSAPLDRGSPPRQIVANADRAIFRTNRELLFRSLAEKRNYLERAAIDGSNRQRVSDRHIIELASVSPDGQWVIVNGPLDAGNSRPGTVAQPIDGGAPRVLCDGPCFVDWSPGGHYLHIEPSALAAGKTILLPIPPGQVWPELPKQPAADGTEWEKLPGARTIPYANVSLGPDPSVYVFRKYSELTNLFRVPLTDMKR